jgi:hypothetical protein
MWFKYHLWFLNIPFKKGQQKTRGDVLMPMSRSRRERTALVQLKTRMRESLRSRLEVAAKAHGTSINAEIVDCIERTFARLDLLSDVLTLAYGRKMAGILMMLGSAMPRAGIYGLWSHTDPLRDNNDLNSWTDDPTAFDQAILAAVTVLDALRPTGDVLKSKSAGGDRVANDVIHAVRKKSADKDHEVFSDYAWTSDTIRSLLGPSIVERIEEPRAKESKS